MSDCAKGLKGSPVPDKALNEIFPLKEIKDVFEKHGFKEDHEVYSLYTSQKGKKVLMMMVEVESREGEGIHAMYGFSGKF